ncbi:hypothetical protein [Ruminococcus bicirculans (ex Wegman et al. 2014)]|uniref:Uncharacterized protein n=1 Tax=Ruminococcus bicirculans (ex Wegman et al. 2014) TaxID=1160721 RepID=A0AAW6E5T6_9FIRM|nr:hypothetical protein [Ruminococcus bicirculans (ex Wegman et al. 2014)]MDB8737177.1 hypothetical protein [Ruminococcus bicirculans (ex Wegman et al. 2014)]MDB8743386.1 hypothetical protein [Ruminococcus bicirculans (ex Wegman et al. 2014)]
MTITLNADYDVTLNTALLGYVGETNARPVTVEGMEIDGADRYVMTIDYGGSVTYEVDITGGQWTPTADILRSAQTVSCQIAAKKLSGDEYILVKKSRIFRLRIGAAIGDTAVPLPSVAADALDRISAIGEQVEADVARAENAASTAMQAAENAEKSATTAGVSADTATQAASRAETAQASAETSATQADTARQGAETARQQAVTAQNAAKISAAQASTAAQQTEADKTITAGYAKTAKTCADSTAADRQAVQDMATKVTADKATVADHAAKVAEDRTAAETAAQTAQAVADSLPDDYVTAVGKIAENTAEIANVKLTDKELQRRVNALYSIGQGITHQFETDTDTAYQKTVPTGAKLMSVKSIGGHSEVIDGEIVSAGVTEVVEQGRNLFDVEKCAALGLYYGFEIDTNKTLQIALKDEKTCPTNVSFGIVYVHGNTMANWLITSNGVRETITNSRDMTDSTQIMVACYPGNKETMQSIADAFDIMLVDGIYKSDTMPAYAPYHSNVYPIPETIRALPGYGWSAGTARNYVDYENKRYVQCVSSVDLGTLAWSYRPEQQRFYAIADSITGKFSESFGIVPNIVVAKYDIVCFNDITTKTDNMKASAVKTANDYITIRNTAYTDAAAFKQAMSGVILHYELANPIITDISDLIPDDFLRNIEVEAGGSVTFKNSNDNYRIPVPSEEEYVVKLSEVGGTT